ncbi:hypothetical protein BJ508DRAFT_96128 [Ascobolus immersus RN42]|uniref:Uncharacterized protein n=1 Tax=Ascobolus immersus RN42 TaxID=1160509 RepID=A0A3N4IZN6_ASCIM|nr:hypothetical protein BJ508DRAFT_96128 [Ascobolus immersus RN42]
MSEVFSVLLLLGAFFLKIPLMSAWEKMGGGCTTDGNDLMRMGFEMVMDEEWGHLDVTLVFVWVALVLLVLGYGV